MHGLPTVTAELTLLSTAAGGRAEPVSLNHPTAHYRPHIVIGDPGQRRALAQGNDLLEDYAAVQFEAADLTLRPGGPSQLVRMTLAFFPGPQYTRVVPGAHFTLREGGKIVGYGTILRREDGLVAATRDRLESEHPRRAVEQRDEPDEGS